LDNKFGLAAIDSPRRLAYSVRHRRRIASRSLSAPVGIGTTHGNMDMMRAFVISFIVGFGVGVAYALIRVKSPAPPLVALAGLLGMVLGESLILRYVVHR